MNDIKKVVQDELIKGLFKQVQKSIKNPEPITVKLKEDELDVFDYFTKEDLENGVELFQDELDFINNATRKLGKVTYDMNTRQ